MDGVWVRMYLWSGFACWFNSLFLFSQLEPSSLELEFLLIVHSVHTSGMKL